VIVQYGGQTPLKLARALEANGAPMIGTSPESIDLAEDRERFQKLIQQLGLTQPRTAPRATASRRWRWRARSAIRWWCARATCSAGARWRSCTRTRTWSATSPSAVKVSNDSPVLLDRFLDNAIEVDVDVVADATGAVLIGGVMEHIEEAGVHSGDSSCSLPPYSLSAEIQDRLRVQVAAMARALKVIGLMNTQFAIQGEDIYVLEVNPRASRTVPFVAKATGVPLAKIAARCMVGRTLAEQGRPARWCPRTTR
jgi:carbamoyl-phosphate synthase large subunit